MFIWSVRAAEAAELLGMVTNKSVTNFSLSTVILIAQRQWAHSRGQIKVAAGMTEATLGCYLEPEVRRSFWLVKFKVGKPETQSPSLC